MFVELSFFELLVGKGISFLDLLDLVELQEVAIINQTASLEARAKRLRRIVVLFVA